MNKLVCPFCQKELVKDFDGYYTCYTDNCGCWANGGNGASGSESLWLTLIRTRKALDVARHTIGWINQMIDEHTDKQAIKIKCEYALDQIKQITETKDNK